MLRVSLRIHFEEVSSVIRSSVLQIFSPPSTCMYIGLFVIQCFRLFSLESRFQAGSPNYNQGLSSAPQLYVCVHLHFGTWAELTVSCPEGSTGAGRRGVGEEVGGGEGKVVSGVSKLWCSMYFPPTPIPLCIRVSLCALMILAKS